MHNPPNEKALRAALAKLPHCEKDARLLSRALHLALPVSENASMSVLRSLQGLVYRKTTTPEIGDVVDIALNVARAGQRKRDKYLDLYADPSTWLKVTRSGSRRVVFGARLLFDTPEISLDDDVDEGVVSKVLALALSGEVAPPHLIALEDGSALLDGDKDHWVVRSSHVTRRPVMAPFAQSEECTTFCEQLRQEFGGESAELVTLGHLGTQGAHVEVLIARGEWEIIVPAVVTQDSYLVGVVDAMVRDETITLSVPDDMDVLGSARYEDAVVARHRASDTRVLVRPLHWL